MAAPEPASVAIKAEVVDSSAETIALGAMKTLYGGRQIAQRRES